MTFYYQDNSIYLHSSRKGRKIDILKKNSMARFEAYIETEVMTTDDPAI